MVRFFRTCDVINPDLIIKCNSVIFNYSDILETNSKPDSKNGKLQFLLYDANFATWKGHQKQDHRNWSHIWLIIFVLNITKCQGLKFETKQCLVIILFYVHLLKRHKSPTLICIETLNLNIYTYNSGLPSCRFPKHEQLILKYLI